MAHQYCPEAARATAGEKQTTEEEEQTTRRGQRLRRRRRSRRLGRLRRSGGRRLRGTDDWEGRRTIGKEEPTTEEPRAAGEELTTGEPRTTGELSRKVSLELRRNPTREIPRT